MCGACIQFYYAVIFIDQISLLILNNCIVIAFSDVSTVPVCQLDSEGILQIIEQDDSENDFLRERLMLHWTLTGLTTEVKVVM